MCTAVSLLSLSLSVSPAPLLLLLLLFFSRSEWSVNPPGLCLSFTHSALVVQQTRSQQIAGGQWTCLHRVAPNFSEPIGGGAVPGINLQAVLSFLRHQQQQREAEPCWGSEETGATDISSPPNYRTTTRPLSSTAGGRRPILT